MTVSEHYYKDALLMGSQEPSVRTHPSYVISDGQDAVRLFSLGGITLDPWQSTILEDWLAIQPTGRWMASVCGGAVPRQNGKSLLVQARSAFGMLLNGERVIYTAHIQKSATEMFNELRSFFESDPVKAHVKVIKSAIGREEILLHNGGRIQFLARTRAGGRGMHCDLLVFDEAQELDEEQQASFVPALSASLNPQTIYIGTPPTTLGTGMLFIQLREKGHSKKENNLAWFEFSVEKDKVDIHDPRIWAKANPALGRRMLKSTIEAEIAQMDEEKFCMERLGWWRIIKTTVDPAINLSHWAKCKSDEMKPEGKTAYGVKFTADGSMVYLCGAVIPKEGKARISVIDYKPTGCGLQWLADWLSERYKTASCVVIDGRNGVDVLIDKIVPVWRLKGSILRPGVKDIIAATSLLVNAIDEGRLTWYSSQGILDDSVKTSTKRPIAGGWGFGGDLSGPIEACSLALWGATTSKRDPTRKMRIG